MQVVDVYEESHCARKRAIATTNQGLCMAMLIDFYKLGDEAIDLSGDGYYTDSSLDE